MTDPARSETAFEDDSFFLELERACKRLSVADVKASSSDLQRRLEHLQKRGEPLKPVASVSTSGPET